MAVPKPNITNVISQIPNTNFAVGRGAALDEYTFHHIVGDAGAALARFKTAGQQASSTYVIGSDGKIYQCVSESNTPYTNGGYAGNTRAITVEHAGGHSSVPYTAAMYKSAIHLLAWTMDRRPKITRFKRHRDVAPDEYPTACPGGLDVERIIREAKAMVERYNNEMVTLQQQTVLYRFYLQSEVSEAGKANVGKKTFAEEVERLKNSDRFKKLTADAAASTLDPVKHLPSTLRTAYVPPAAPAPTPGPTPQVLDPGLYEVKQP